MARGKRFSFICGSSSAVARPNRASSSDTAPQDEKMPTSQPMQRSTESLWGEENGPSYLESDSSNLSDASTQSDASTPPTSYMPYATGLLHDPPNPDEASLLRNARSYLVLTLRHRHPSIKGHTLTTRFRYLLSSTT